jgi:hypothetical protein
MNRAFLLVGAVWWAGCNCGAAVGGETDPDDAGVFDAGANVQPDAGAVDAGTCPTLRPDWSFDEIGAGCPGDNTTSLFGTTLTQTGCALRLENPARANSRLWFDGTVRLDETGSFAATAFTLNDAGVTCAGTRDAGPPERLRLDCGACQFTLKPGD